MLVEAAKLLEIPPTADYIGGAFFSDCLFVVSNPVVVMVIILYTSMCAGVCFAASCFPKRNEREKMGWLM